jgi:uncharacterized protein (TIGR00251 family)
VSPDGGPARLRVRVQPRSSTSEIARERDGVLVVRLAAPPVEGRANEELCRLIARWLRVGKGSVEVVRGGRSREKLVQVRGLTQEALRDAIDDLL